MSARSNQARSAADLGCNPNKTIRQRSNQEIRDALAEMAHDERLGQQEAFAQTVTEMSVPPQPVEHPAGWFPDPVFHISHDPD